MSGELREALGGFASIDDFAAALISTSEVATEMGAVVIGEVIVRAAKIIRIQASARDEALEEAARVAAAWQSSLKPGSQDRLFGHVEAARDIANAIRALKSPPADPVGCRGVNQENDHG